MAHTEELKKWDALEHICVCFLPGETVRQLDILLNPAAPLRNDWRMVADRLGYNFNETQVGKHGKYILVQVLFSSGPCSK